MSDQNTSESLVDCYQCTGENQATSCGIPIKGCSLCESYGNGNGKLLKEKSIPGVQTVVNSVSGDRVFTAPSWSCTRCRDTKTAKRQVWIKALENPGWSDYGSHDMPSVEVPCWKCGSREESDRVFNIKRTELKKSYAEL